MATIVQDLEQARAECETLKTANAALVTRAETAEKSLAEAHGIVAKSDEAIKQACEASKQAEEALKAEQSAHGETKAMLEKAKSALANTAFAAAAADGLKTATAEGGSPPAEQPMTKEEAIRIYNNMPDGLEGAKLRAAFRVQHKELLGL